MPDESIYTRYKHGKYIQVPFEEGESIMISHAVFACLEKQKQGISVSPITDDDIHEQILLNRLKRQIKSKEFNEISKVNNAIEMVIPKPKGTIDEIIDMRTLFSKPLQEIKLNILNLSKVMQNTDENNLPKIKEIKDDILKSYKEMDLIENETNTNIIDTKIDHSFTELIGGSKWAIIGMRSIPKIEYGNILYPSKYDKDKKYRHSGSDSNSISIKLFT